MKKALTIIGNAFLWLIVIFSLVVTILVFSSTNSNGVANFLGYIPLTVESPSMHPTFDEGDLIICKQIEDPYTLQVDDVITFWTLIDGQKVKNTHRIVRINDTGNSISFITRGDNNPIDDELPAYQSELIGKWTNIRLTGAGKIMAFIRTKLGFFVCIIIPMALFFLLELYKFIITVISLKNAENVPELDEEEIKRRAIEEYLAQQKMLDESDKKLAEAKKNSESDSGENSDNSNEKSADEKSPENTEKSVDEKSPENIEKSADNKESTQNIEKSADEKSTENTEISVEENNENNNNNEKSEGENKDDTTNA